MPQPPHEDVNRWHFAAAAAGWLVPGLGHYLLGDRGRGLVIGATILALWLGGLFIGGLSAIDRTKHPAWFAMQIIVSPSILVDYYHSRLRKTQGKGPLPTDALGITADAWTPQGVSLRAIATEGPADRAGLRPHDVITHWEDQPIATHRDLVERLMASSAGDRVSLGVRRGTQDLVFDVTLSSYAYEPSFGRTNEQGVLYVGIAGMLNLLAIMDVVYRDPQDARRRKEEGDALPTGEAVQA